LHSVTVALSSLSKYERKMSAPITPKMFEGAVALLEASASRTGGSVIARLNVTTKPSPWASMYGGETAARTSSLLEFYRIKDKTD